MAVETLNGDCNGNSEKKSQGRASGQRLLRPHNHQKLFEFQNILAVSNET